MKKAILYIILFLTCINCALAQKDTQAKTILARLSSKYRSYNVIKTNFTFLLNSPNTGGNQTQNGTLIANSKNGKFKVTLFKPGSKTEVEQEIMSDGKTQWTYLKDDKEVQVNNVSKTDADNEINPARLFTIYEHGYKYLYTGDQRISGKLCQVIDLTPENADKTFFKIRLLIDKARNQLYSAQLFDKGGNRYTYTLNTFTPNVSVPESTFTFNAKAHPGVEVVDLR